MHRSNLKTKAITATEYIKLTNLQKIALANMDFVGEVIEAEAYVPHISFKLGRIYEMVKDVDIRNSRMLLSFLDNYGLVSDYDMENAVRYAREVLANE